MVADLEGQDVRVFDRAKKQFVAERTVPLTAKVFMPAFIDAKILVPTQAPDGLVRVGRGAGGHRAAACSRRRRAPSTW